MHGQDYDFLEIESIFASLTYLEIDHPEVPSIPIPESWIQPPLIAHDMGMMCPGHTSQCQINLCGRSGGRKWRHIKRRRMKARSPPSTQIQADFPPSLARPFLPRPVAPGERRVFSWLPLCDRGQQDLRHPSQPRGSFWEFKDFILGP